MSNGEKAHRRRTYLIQRVFQTKFIILFVLLIILSSLLSGVVLYKKTNIELGHHYGEAHSKLKNTGEILLPNVLTGNVLAIIIIGVASIVLTILISHKIAGPLYRFEKNAVQIGQGDLTVVTKLRQSDQIHGLADAFSNMTLELREKLISVQKSYEELPALVDEIKKLSRNKTISSEELLGIGAKLSRISSNLEESLKNFKLYNE